MGKKQDNAVVLSEQDRYNMLHSEIVQYGNMATSCFVQFMAKLKEMRDGKLYKAAGIETFAEYVEQQVGLRERQAYNYITAYENFSQDFLHSNAKIGITKLLLLSPLDEETRDEIMAEVDVENTTVKELKQFIAEREQQIAERDEQILERDMRISEQEQEIRDFDALLDKKDEQVQAVTAERDALKQQKDEWQNAVNNHKQLTEQLQKATEEKQALEQQIDDLKNAPAKVELETVDNPETVAALEQAQRYIQELEAKQLELETKQKDLTKKLEVANDETMSKFKTKFEDLQIVGQELLQLLSAMNDANNAKCRDALKAVVEGWYL